MERFGPINPFVFSAHFRENSKKSQTLSAARKRAYGNEHISVGKEGTSQLGRGGARRRERDDDGEGKDADHKSGGPRLLARRYRRIRASQYLLTYNDCYVKIFDCNSTLLGRIRCCRNPSRSSPTLPLLRIASGDPLMALA